VININLSEYADGLNPETKVKVEGKKADLWTYIAGNSTPTFYYNKVVEAGTTSELLIDSITLDSSVTTDAYYAFDYNLAIKLDSIQVTVDKDGNQKATALEAWTEVEAKAEDETTTVGQTTAADDTTKIGNITWKETTTVKTE
jgi:hypothetical protein